MEMGFTVDFSCSSALWEPDCKICLFAQLILQSILKALQLLTQWSLFLGCVGDQFESVLSSSAPHELSAVHCGQLVRRRGQPRLKMYGKAVALN